MFGAFTSFGKLGSLARAIAAAWTPSALWPTGTEPGMWIDPSNLTSQWQDSAGTTPVVTPGTVADSANPCGLILDRHLGATTPAGSGTHLFQATSTARPLVSAQGGQPVNPDGTYSATGFPIYLDCDGTDDGLASASFSAGTLTSDMDCLIAVRRDSNPSSMICGFYQTAGGPAKYFAEASDSVGPYACFAGCGAPTVWVDGVQLAGGTSVTISTLSAALTCGDFHILELRDLDLSAWVSMSFGAYGSGYNFNGAFGGALLFPGGNTAGRDAARTWLGAKVGLTL